MFLLMIAIRCMTCAGVSGVVEAYKEAITRIQLWGPTNIAPIISHVARFAAQSQATDTRPCVS